MAETILVVAIIIVLLAVVGIMVMRYQKRLHQMEMDGHAKEILVAAQNHLSTAKSQGYLGLETFGTKLDKSLVRQAYNGVEADDVYYYIVNGSSSFNDSTSLLGAMLPQGAVDETLRLSGSYVIVYQKSSGTVLDVFYAQPSGTRYAYSFSADDMPAGSDTELKLLSYAGDGQSSARAGYKGGSKNVIGWFGNASPILPAQPSELEAPLLRVYNGETLFALVFPENADSTDFNQDYDVKLEIKGAESNKSKSLTLNVTGNQLKTYESVITANMEASLIGKKCFQVVLDDITEYNTHFATQFGGTGGLIPGEDILLTAKITSKADDDEELSSPTYRTNSLFAYNSGDDSGTQKIAQIGCFRHLENLDQRVSDFSISGTGWSYVAASGENAGCVQAIQISDLNWDWHGSNNKTIYFASSTPAAAASAGYYYPVSPSYALAYNGGEHSISNVVVSDVGANAGTADSSGAGLFGTLGSSSVKNLQLVDFSVSGYYAGALAGKLNSSKAENVVAYHSSGKESNKVASNAAGGNAGGLIGYAKGTSVSPTTVTKCAAALYVEASGGTAGGLIGKAENNTSVSSSYSGGHTKNGQYYDKTSDTYIYNVKAATAGGFVGSADGGTITNCYSTCSAQGATAGGFAGSADGVTIGNCYATGLVQGTTAAGAFAGLFGSDMTVSSSKYYMIVNETLTAKDAVYLTPVGTGSASGITALDEDPAVYNTFVGAPSTWRKAKPYDSTLYTYYGGKYALGARAQLGLTSDSSFVATHYGDWPAPETWVFNK